MVIGYWKSQEQENHCYQKYFQTPLLALELVVLQHLNEVFQIFSESVLNEVLFCLGK